MILEHHLQKRPFWPKIQPFLQLVKAENETNGPKPVVTVSNQTYLPITSDLSTYEGRNLGFF